MFSQELRSRVAVALKKRLGFLILILLGIVLTAVAYPVPRPRTKTMLQEVAHFDHEVTCVAAATEGRIFVTFPRWTEDSAISVAEVGRDGKLTPYPNAEWNAGTLSPENHLVCVQIAAATSGSSILGRQGSERS